MLQNAALMYSVRQNPAVTSPPAASTKSRTRVARSSGVAWAVASSTVPAEVAGLGGASPGQPGSAGLSREEATVRSTRSRSPSITVVEPAVVRPSRCSRSRTLVIESATFWWMYELANRVSASASRSTTTSASAAGPATSRTRSSTWEATSSWVSVTAVIPAPPPARL